MIQKAHSLREHKLIDMESQSYAAPRTYQQTKDQIYSSINDRTINLMTFSLEHP
jgi:hypothetical protein